MELQQLRRTLARVKGKKGDEEDEKWWSAIRNNRSIRLFRRKMQSKCLRNDLCKLCVATPSFERLLHFSFSFVYFENGLRTHLHAIDRPKNAQTIAERMLRAQTFYPTFSWVLSVCICMCVCLCGFRTVYVDGYVCFTEQMVAHSTRQPGSETKRPNRLHWSKNCCVWHLSAATRIATFVTSMRVLAETDEWMHFIHCTESLKIENRLHTTRMGKKEFICNFIYGKWH